MAAYGTRMARIALDIDSTLHDYWPLFRRVVHERHGLDLPYEEQREWGTTLLPRDDVVACIEETHSDENILAAEPYPGAVETVTEWHARGPLDPHHLAPAQPRRTTRPPGGSSGSACPTTTSTARSTR